MNSATPKQAIHEFEKAGLGKYPFRLTSVTEKKFCACQGAPVQPGSSCDYCGTAIMYEFWVKSSDNKTFKVGCDCILRLNNDPKLIDEAKSARKLQQKQVRNAKKTAAFKAYQESRKSEAVTKALTYRTTNAEFVADLEKFAEQNPFLTSLLGNLTNWGRLSEAQETPAKRIIATLKERELAPVSQYVGTVGSRTELTLTTVHVVDITPANQPYGYGSKYLYICKDDGGNSVTYCGNSYALPTKGETKRLVATIKEHSEYKGVAQTKIERPKEVK